MCVACVAVASLPLLLGNPADVRVDHMQIFAQPIDAVSVAFDDTSKMAQVRGFDGTAWTPWELLAVDNEQDPLSTESNLVTFPFAVQKVQVKSATNVELHPITISRAPLSYEVAALTPVGMPRILSRSQWGADESLRFTTPKPDTAADETPDETRQDNGNGGDTVNARIEECNAAIRDYPQEFKTARTVRNEDGKRLRWPLQYSKKINMLVVHHTAQTVTGDARSGVERMRAVYQYHATNRGWGDIGYNYIIDDTGQIYEGRAGGDNVVSGHAYCNNVGTLGIALMGNFEVEEPTQAQIKALQWLLADLAQKHDIDLDRSVSFHGKTRSPVSVHGDLLATSCPGFYLNGAMDQVRKNVMSGDVAASVTFPVKPVKITTTDKPYVDRSAERRSQRLQGAAAQTREGLYAVTPTELNGNPGQEILISLKYVAGATAAKRGKGIGAIVRSDDGIGLWLDRNGSYERLRTSLTLPEALNAWESLTMQFKVSFPLKEGTSSLTIGGVTYKLQASGRRSRTSTVTAPETTTTRTTIRRETVVRPTSSSSSSVSSRSSASSASSVSSESSNVIRIRLSYPDNKISASVYVNTDEHYVLKISGNNCIQTIEGREIARAPVVRVKGSFTITSWDKPQNRFRGTLECRVIDHKMVLINELPLEDYMKGLAEEPDTEHFEKQKAFAIAARSYAMHYMGTKYRKFPGLPYDGSDNPSNFQKYGGMRFEEDNKQWVKAVDETVGQVLVKNGEVIRAPYFHSDAGRTKSPQDVGWLSFPHSEIYQSKPDPWCEGGIVAGHGVGMSGCGAKGQAKEGKTAKEILSYYYPGAVIERR